MKADFSGYATKAGLKCSDGRTIMPDAFKHQDQARVPLVWQHGHSDPENVLGHVILENRNDGVYAYGFFNSSPKAVHTNGLVQHKDITCLSIWANQLIERAGNVLHGAIREVSLVLSGANPGAVIENVSIRHSDGDEQILDDEAIIYTGLELEHSSTLDDKEVKPVTVTEDKIQHAEDEDETVEDVYNSMSQKQKDVLHFMIGEAVAAAGSGEMGQSDLDIEDDEMREIYDSMNAKEQAVVRHMIGEAIEHGTTIATNTLEGSTMTHNVFETGKTNQPVLTHADVEGIMADATKNGSLKDAVESWALEHGITDIETLFPEARTLANTPEMFRRRTEWVNIFLGGVRKTPFSRIKTISADLTLEDARAKGYVKGALKKEEFFGVQKRITIPTTVYKKQKLDRDDMVDITDFDVVAWLKAEMRVMLDEEIARAGLIGDGRDVAHEDKINEGNIRPIATDHELYVTTVNVNITDASSSVTEVIDSVILNRRFLRGTGLPIFFTTETIIAMFMLLKDSTGRRIYKTLDEIANEMRVSQIVPVEVMEDEPDIVGILVNPVDYTMGADKGGQVSTFDDFDIDYNQYKYLIETRLSGALVKLKSAMVIRKTATANVVVVPESPTFVEATGVVTIPTQTGVVYTNAVTEATLIAGAQAALAEGATLQVQAVPASGYYFPTSEDDSWSFTRPAA